MVRERKESEVRDRRSCVEVLGLSSHPEEDCFNSFPEPIARVPKWLKEASIEMDRHVNKEGKCMVMPLKHNNLVKHSGELVAVTSKPHHQKRMGDGFVELGGWKSKNGVNLGELVRAPASNMLS